MADYYPVIARAVSRLDRNTVEARQALYECARSVLVTQLTGRFPVVPETDLSRERLALETAISKVESELVAGQPSDIRAGLARATSNNSLEAPAQALMAAIEDRPSAGSMSSRKPRAQPLANSGSTFMHESAHLWLDHLVDYGARMREGSQLKTDLDTVLAWLGVEKPEDIATEHYEKWARAFERYLAEGNAPSSILVPAFDYFKRRSSDELDTPITDEVRRVFDRMLATDEEMARTRTLSESLPAANIKLVVKGLFGFALGFILVLGLEMLLFGGMEFLSGHRLRPIGAGWIIMPILAGCGGWKLFRELDLAAALGFSRVFAELRNWPRRHKVALALAIAIGWFAGVLLGFFASVTGRADYYPRTLETWAFGHWYWSYRGEISVQYFPWASLGWGLVGGIVGAAIVYIRQLLRPQTTENALPPR